MDTNIRYELWDVVNRLKELGAGLTVACVRDAVRRGYVATAHCTLNHPPLFRGTTGWAEIVCALREYLQPYEWLRSDANSYSVVINPSRDIAIAVATGNEHTGNRNASPSTKSEKGPQTEAAILLNQAQLSLDLFDDADMAQEATADEPVDARITYLLLVHRNANEVRFELSLPDKINDGRINGWRERIIFEPMPLDGEPIEINPPSQPDLDIGVKRRAS